VICAVGTYWQTAQFDFVNYDDPEYVTANSHVRAGITADGVAWAFTSTEAANWFPLTRLSHMLDWQLFDQRGGAHHLVNVALHALAAVLLFAFLLRATGQPWPSAFVAFVFALHPLHVESVAWIAERKDVLSAVFWFFSLWAYVAGRRWLVLVAFCAGLMAKPMIVTLPLVLLLIDIWPLRRKPAVKEKLPLFAIAVAAAVFTFVVQQASGAVRALTVVPLGTRAENALVSYGWYLLKTVWPADLAVFYPYPKEIPLWQPLVAGAAIAGISVLVWNWRNERPYLVVGWLWFLVTLAPVIGLVQVGSQARADRYMYVPMIGLLIMLAWSLPRIAVLTAVVGCALVPLAWAQAGYWQNSETLFRHALAVTGDNAVAEHNLGSALLDQPGRLAQAERHLRVSVRLVPDSVRAHTDLGSALAKRGRFQEAMDEFHMALGLDPNSEITRHNLESATEGAVQAHYRRGMDLAKAGGAGEAEGELEQALRIQPDFAEAHNDLGVLLSQMPGRTPEAMAQFGEAINLKPDYVDARYNLAVALAESGRRAEAIRELERALQVRDDPQIREALGQLRQKH
jgi:tetratricopeptide (TPR) repeat protein